MISQYLFSFVAYFSILLAIGIISHQKQTSNAEFVMGNRSLNFWVTALSAHASDMSAWLFMGLPMVAYMQGFSGGWIAIGLVVGMFLNWQFVAAKLRTETEKYQSCTISTYFEKRYKDASGALRLLTAAMFLFFLTHYLSAALMAMGLLLESLFGIDYYVGLSFALCVVVAYTFGGGFVTIAWTDLFQALFLLLVIITVPLLAMFQIEGGLQTVLSYSDHLKDQFILNNAGSGQSFLASIFLAVAWGVGYFGQPHIITKFMGIKDVSEMKNAKYVGMSWQILALFFSIFVGVVGATYFDGSLDSPQLVFVDLVKVLFHPLIGGFILCAILAANLSTMDSQLLVCASVIGEDIYKRVVPHKPSDLELVRASRFGVILIALIALMIAFNRSETIIDSVLYAWAGLGSAFGPLVLMSLYYKKGTKYGAISGIIVGGLVAALWGRINPMLTIVEIPAMIPGFSLSALSIFLVSRATYTNSNA